MRKLVLHPQGWEDMQHWAFTDKRIFRRLVKVIDDTLRNPFEGIGKPEPLKGDLSGFWSRRIDGEHRLVYAVTSDEIIVAQARYHY
ncbi:toxin YoeB [Streptomyces sp. V4I23]|uniref:Txe/YoeB family addiction module toxin n=1 Tax=Streptomyces sp. V4I23 TaxID=3042282 RepID=UPI00278237F5|nr:Txe/YoeB family addiction module toxin [Streptomyces sp. V4I23]MDQ1008158.1 toxin YoeB [Streptomyces sp. V4I23]